MGIFSFDNSFFIKSERKVKKIAEYIKNKSKKALAFASAFSCLWATKKIILLVLRMNSNPSKI